MFKHNLLITYRNFKRSKISFFINLVGLSTGLACTLLIYLWVQDELRFDKFHEKDARLYQVMEHWQYSDRNAIEDGTPGLLAQALAEEMPEVEYASTVIPASWNPNLTLTVADKNIRAAGQSVGEDYFKMFSFQFLHGDKNNVFRDKNSIVISEDLATKLFGTTEGVLGKVIEYQHSEKYTVSGIFKNIPANSSLQFDYVLSYERGIKDSNPWLMDWGNSAPETYLTLKEGTDAARFNERITNFLASKGQGPHRTLFIKQFSDNYLYGHYENGQQAGGRIEYVILFSIIAVFILVIACINFMNLSTAKATRRLKEVGIKKTVGAHRHTLIAQYLGESLLMTAVSLILAITLVEFFLPQFNEITGKQLSLQFDSTLVLSLLTITLVTGLIAGSYPAFYLSGFRPVRVLKGGGASIPGVSGGNLWARKGLVVFQFSLSIMLIVAVIVVYKQVDFVQNRNLGYTKDNIIYFNKEGEIRKKLETFLSEAKNLPGIADASSISESLVGHNSATDGIEWQGKAPDELIEFETVHVNYGMLEMLDIELTAGRLFSASHGADHTTIIFNEAAIAAMGLTDPIGKTVKVGGEDRQIIGTTANFHFESLHKKVKPLFFVVAPRHTSRIMAKIEAGKEQEAIAGLQKLYNTFNPGFPFSFTFLDEDYQAQYIAEKRVSVLSRYFAGIAILISCLGLYGLAAFAAEQRTKEIGIRKVLGASVSSIMALLSKDFLALVCIAVVAGSALAWLAMHKWLDNFAYHIELGIWIFGVAGAVSLLIAVCTVSFQALKAARANPVHNLRSE